MVTVLYGKAAMALSYAPEIFMDDAMKAMTEGTMKHSYYLW
jgi:hypothetical protein